jgi:hypothetical protein
MKLARLLILLGSIVLFASGLLHLLGYPYIYPPLVKAGVDAKLIGAIKAVWSAFTVQFVVVSAALVWLSRRPQGRSLILFLCLIPLIDAVLMYLLVGPFIGSYLVSAGTVLVLIGAWLLPSSQNSLAQ